MRPKRSSRSRLRPTVAMELRVLVCLPQKPMLPRNTSGFPPIRGNKSARHRKKSFEDLPGPRERQWASRKETWALGIEPLAFRKETWRGDSFTVNREHPENHVPIRELSTSFRSRNQGNPSLEELQESGPASGESLAVVEVMGARDGSAGIIAGAMGADAHAPNAPAFIVPGVLLSNPRTVNPPSREQPENHELARELSNLYRISDENFLEQQNYHGHRNMPSQNILSISGVRHGIQELDHYDSSPDIFNDFQIRDQETPPLEELQESGQTHGNLVAIEEAVGIVRVMGADAHAPNAPAVYSFSIPRTVNLPENHELARELSNLNGNWDENFLEQQNYHGHINIPSQDILGMSNGVRHGIQELDHYDSSPDIFNEFQMRTLYPAHQNYEAVDDYPFPVFALVHRAALQDDEQYPHTPHSTS
ncbi:uncharacterized protein LOC119572075 isoform X2 [Penaeus monodon]|uniref:uncharacterized protein LOC119572075 isoform X2 n=1 Tax=Penaeus monodon TaxID=6687 RepID=UPI0018A7C5F9|nr:uncharacterized protein LOC119572075 isoform X2 [Penaeus monodon]XP_037775021.1 uncharacterized protein LOC119572075 isoform X2 [Penaeus monodon]